MIRLWWKKKGRVRAAACGMSSCIVQMLKAESLKSEGRISRPYSSLYRPSRVDRVLRIMTRFVTCITEALILCLHPYKTVVTKKV